MALIVLDSASASEIGGTESALEAWRQLGVAVELIALDTLRKRLKTPSLKTAVASQTPTTAVAASAGQKSSIHLNREIKTMLFADMVGFSKLIEGSAPAFVVNFLGEIAKVIDGTVLMPAFKNTWGDGLFLVFDEIAVGADFALRLRDNIHQTDWTAVGLPADTNIRMGMHAGPVFLAFTSIRRMRQDP